MYAGATFIEQSIKINLYLAVVILLGIAALFTITGKNVFYLTASWLHF